jgi:hypothetical protein
MEKIMSNKTISIGIFIVFMLFIFSGCTAPLVSEWDEKSSIDAPPPLPEVDRSPLYDYKHSVKQFSGDKWTVAILRFGDTRQLPDIPYGNNSNKTNVTDGSIHIEVKEEAIDLYNPQTWPQLSRRSKMMLKHALIESKAFLVVERERIEEILREIDFGDTQYANSDKKLDVSILPARYIIEGSLGLNEDKDLGVTNYLSCYLSVYDITTGEVVASVASGGKTRPLAIEGAVADLINKMPASD